MQSGVLTPAINVFFQKDRSRVSFSPLSKSLAAKPSFDKNILYSPNSFKTLDVNDTSSDKIESNATIESSDHALYDEQLESLEISPLAFGLVEEISKSVMTHKSAALLVDYGENYPQVSPA